MTLFSPLTTRENRYSCIALRILSVDHIQCPQIAKIFKATDLLDTNLVHEIIKPVPDKPVEPKVVLEGSQSGIRLSFDTNREPFLQIPD